MHFGWCGGNSCIASQSVTAAFCGAPRTDYVDPGAVDNAHCRATHTHTHRVGVRIHACAIAMHNFVCVTALFLPTRLVRSTN